jgi:hypothetical protein
MCLNIEYLVSVDVLISFPACGPTANGTIPQQTPGKARRPDRAEVHREAGFGWLR